MSVEVIADCDECNDRFDKDGRDKTYCQTCYDSRVKELEDEITELKSELDDVKDELEDMKKERERGWE